MAKLLFLYARGCESYHRGKKAENLLADNAQLESITISKSQTLQRSVLNPGLSPLA